jgi:hypothetical protein
VEDKRTTACSSFEGKSDSPSNQTKWATRSGYEGNSHCSGNFGAGFYSLLLCDLLTNWMPFARFVVMAIVS